jgi:hypothetical protein
MTSGLRLLDDDGHLLALGSGRPLDLGPLAPGATSEPQRVWAKNTGSEPLQFVHVRATLHPKDQRGAAEATLAATEFALHPQGAYAPEVDLGTLRPGDARPFWLRWTAPKGPAPMEMRWAVEARGATA